MSSSNYSPVTTVNTRRLGDNSTRYRDVQNRLKVTQNKNIFDADFEYGSQPLRWEALTTTGGSVVHLPGQGGVQMTVNTTSGAIAMRQSRPYHRYQPGKSMAMASAIVFGGPVTNNRTRVGFFDDSNGAFWEQGDTSTTNPFGMNVVVRTDTSGTPTDTIFSFENWSDPYGYKIKIDWLRIQMVFVEYAWYGAGMVRFGVVVDGESIPLHEVGYSNRTSQLTPWARTGNLPVRYETRNVGTTAASTTFTHYGVSVLVDGGVDEQRGFTYAYGMAPATPRRTVAASSTRFPVMSFRNRLMGTLESGNTTGVTLNSGAITAGTVTSLTCTGTPWTANAYAGRYVTWTAGTTTYSARITSNTTSVLTIVDSVTGGAVAVAPAAGNAYTIGLPNRGLILPQSLLISSSALCVVELIASTTSSPVTLTGATFAPLSSLGSTNSFAERDVSATVLTGGEVVLAFTAPLGGSGLLNLSLENLFPLYNNIRGSITDIMTVAVTTPAASAADVGVHIISQEAMS